MVNLIRAIISWVIRITLLAIGVAFGLVIIRAYKNKSFEFQTSEDDDSTDLGPMGIDEIIRPSLEDQVLDYSIKKDDLIKKYSKKLNKRQLVILSLLADKKLVEVTYLLKQIPGVTERTLRRDMVILQDLGLAKKIGKTKSVKYQLLV